MHEVLKGFYYDLKDNQIIFVQRTDDLHVKIERTNESTHLTWSQFNEKIEVENVVGDIITGFPSEIEIVNRYQRINSWTHIPYMRGAHRISFMLEKT